MAHENHIISDMRNFQCNHQKILVVDDSLTIRMQIKDLLEEKGFSVILAENGKKCLDLLETDKPDIILLDLIMPEVSGIEVCKKIKSDIRFQDIPVLILTTVSDVDKKVKGLNAGADDYITKPFEVPELMARISSVIRTKELMKELKHAKEQMEALAEERAQQLVHADRLATIGTLSASVVHEIKNPMTFISTSINILKKFWEMLSNEEDYLLQMPSEHPEKLQMLYNKMPDTLQGMKSGVIRIERIINNLRGFAHKKDDSEKKPVLLMDCVEIALEFTEKSLSNRNIALEKPKVGDYIYVFGDAQQIDQVLINFITNAADAVEHVQNPTIKIDIFKDNTFAYLAVSDNGQGLQPNELEKIWDSFYTTKSSGKGTGLGLYIAKSIIEEHGGKIRAGLMEEGGMRFEFSLPLYTERK